MASNAKKAGFAMAAVLAACAAAAPGLVQHEGWVTHTYADPARGKQLMTGCAGLTREYLQGHTTFDDALCQKLTMDAMVDVGMKISPCLPDQLPTRTRGAFIDLAFNVGPGAFCKSKISAYAKAGNLGRACGAIHGFYVTAAGKRLPGLEARRAKEQADCEAGLRG